VVDEKTVRVTVAEIRVERALAMMVVTDDGEEVWIPMSQVEEIHRSDPPEIVMSEWCAVRKGLL